MREAGKSRVESRELNGLRDGEILNSLVGDAETRNQIADIKSPHPFNFYFGPFREFSDRSVIIVIIVINVITVNVCRVSQVTLRPFSALQNQSD